MGQIQLAMMKVYMREKLGWLPESGNPPKNVKGGEVKPQRFSLSGNLKGGGRGPLPGLLNASMQRKK